MLIRLIEYEKIKATERTSDGTRNRVRNFFGILLKNENINFFFIKICCSSKIVIYMYVIPFVRIFVNKIRVNTIKMVLITENVTRKWEILILLYKTVA